MIRMQFLYAGTTAENVILAGRVKADHVEDFAFVEAAFLAFEIAQVFHSF